MPFLRGKILKNHFQGFGRWIRIRVRAYLRVPGLLAPYLIWLGEEHINLLIIQGLDYYICLVDIPLKMSRIDFQVNPPRT